MANSLDISFIKSFKTGELITEQKLNTIFEYIGTAVNDNASLLQQVQIELSKKESATRWLGEVNTYADIETFIENNKSNEEFKDRPIPQAGDIIFVNDNSDDPNKTQTLAPGRYLYIYSLDVNSDGQQGDVGWKIWIPFALPNASEYNDGLLTKEDYVKLKALPTKEYIDTKNNEQDRDINANRTDINSNINRLNTLENKSTTMETSVNNLNTYKQNIATNLTGFKSKNVEGNLLELKNAIDISKDVFADAVIWQQTSGDGSNVLNVSFADFTWTNEQMTDGNYINTGYYKITANNNNSIADDIFTALRNNDCPIVKTCFNIYLSGGSTNKPVTPDCYYMNYQLNNTEKAFITHDVPMYSTYEQNNVKVARILPFKISITLNYNNNSIGGTTEQSIEINASVVDKQIIDAQTLIWPVGTLPQGATMQLITLSINAVLKDFGKSNITVEEKTLDIIKQTLQKNLGIKEKILTNNPDNTALDTNIIPTNQEIDLGFEYKEPSSLIVTLGGTTLQNGRDYTNAGNLSNGFFNKIKFLYDIDLALNGNLVIKGLSVVNSSLKIVPWDKFTTYSQGDIVSVSENNNVTYWIANLENVNSKPSTTNTNWSQWNINVDAQQIINDVSAKLDPTINDRINNILDSKPNKAFPLFSQGQVSIFNTKSEFLELVNRIKQNYGITLTTGIDYEVYENGRYLMFGENAETGGSFKITQAQLPDISWAFIIRLTGDDSRNTIWNNYNVVTTTIGDPGQTQIETRKPDWNITNRPVTEKVTWYLNGATAGQTQQNFYPTYQKLYTIKWLRDIQVELWLAVKTISSWNADTDYLPSDRCYVKSGTDYNFYYAVKGNRAQNPATDKNGTYWIKDSANITMDDLTTAIASQIKPVVQDELNKLPQSDDIVFKKGERVGAVFADNTQLEKWKEQYGITDDDLEQSPFFYDNIGKSAPARIITVNCNIINRAVENGDLSNGKMGSVYFETDLDVSPFCYDGQTRISNMSVLYFNTTNSSINNYVSIVPTNYWVDWRGSKRILLFRYLFGDSSWATRPLQYPVAVQATIIFNGNALKGGTFSDL